jgi:hypothetical protein
MKNRCHNPANKDFSDYGGRGIIVCKRWRDSFENFFADMGPRPSPKHSLDRYPDNDGNYEPKNVRWATPRQQHQNTRYNRIIRFDGRQQWATAWAQELGFNPQTIAERIKRGWPAERLFVPVYRRKSIGTRKARRSEMR